MSYIEKQFVHDLEWVSWFYLCFLSDSTPQTSPEEGRWTAIVRETGIDFQVEKQCPWKGTGVEFGAAARDGFEVTFEVLRGS